VAPPIDGKDFYTFVATTIPVLYVAFAYQDRASGGFLPDEIFKSLGVKISPRLNGIRALYTLSLVFFLTLGEVAAIVGLVEAFPLSFGSGDLGGFVLFCLSVGGIGVTAPAVMTQFSILLSPLFPPTERSASRMLLLFCGTAMFYGLVILILVRFVNDMIH
jgi:F0F1-type ATP synthase membrane subunit c/vacuolar-type H+-ATPase subunit K